MVYETDFYTVRRPRPTFTSYSVTGGYRPHYGSSSLSSWSVKPSIRSSVLLGELDRIYHRPRPHLGNMALEDYLNSKPLVEFDDETKLIRAETDRLRRRIYSSVPRKSPPLQILPYYGGCYDRINTSPHFEERPHHPMVDHILYMSYYSEPSSRTIGRGHLACVTFAGGKGYPRRRNHYSDENRDIGEEIKTRSYYNNSFHKNYVDAMSLPTGYASYLLRLKPPESETLTNLDKMHIIALAEERKKNIQKNKREEDLLASEQKSKLINGFTEPLEEISHKPLERQLSKTKEDYLIKKLAEEPSIIENYCIPETKLPKQESFSKSEDYLPPSVKPDEIPIKDEGEPEAQVAIEPEPTKPEKKVKPKKNISRTSSIQETSKSKAEEEKPKEEPIKNEEPPPAPKVEPLPAEPEPLPAEPEPLPSEPEPLPAEPEPLPAEPETLPSEPEPVPAEPESLPSEPEPVPAEPESLPSEPELVPAEPEPLPSEPESVEAVPAEKESTEELQSASESREEEQREPETPIETEEARNAGQVPEEQLPSENVAQEETKVEDEVVSSEQPVDASGADAVIDQTSVPSAEIPIEKEEIEIEQNVETLEKDEPKESLPEKAEAVEDEIKEEVDVADSSAAPAEETAALGGEESLDGTGKSEVTEVKTEVTEEGLTVTTSTTVTTTREVTVTESEVAVTEDASDGQGSQPEPLVEEPQSPCDNIITDKMNSNNICEVLSDVAEEES